MILFKKWKMFKFWQFLLFTCVSKCWACIFLFCSAATTGLSADPLSSSSVPSTLMLLFDSSQDSQVFIKSAKVFFSVLNSSLMLTDSTDLQYSENRRVSGKASGTAWRIFILFLSSLWEMVDILSGLCSLSVSWDVIFPKSYNCLSHSKLETVAQPGNHQKYNEK